jgi:hypothetical protein
MANEKRDNPESYAERTKERLRSLVQAPSPLANADAAAVEMRIRRMTYGHRTGD